MGRSAKPAAGAPAPLLSRVSLPLAPQLLPNTTGRPQLALLPPPTQRLSHGAFVPVSSLLKTPLPRGSSRLLPHTLPFLVKGPLSLSFFETRLHYVAQAVLELVM